MYSYYNTMKVYMPWWLPQLGIAFIFSFLLMLSIVNGPADCFSEPSSTGYCYVLSSVFQIPYVLILLFLSAGTTERIGFLFRGRGKNEPGRLPYQLPLVCVQLPMFNEHAVAERAIEAACELEWPKESLEIQVLDDSTDPDTRDLVQDTCAFMVQRGVDIHLMRRKNRAGFKAGALEAGRKRTAADIVVILDSDFLPKKNYLRKAIPYFFDKNGNYIHKLALVQAQWGHLNHDDSFLTAAQSLWVDDHHSVQMSWRSEQWNFVNFTGTAGLWRADAIEHAGGWRSASLVEDCELSFRHLFAGYNTRFVKEVVVPAELPDTYTAYKAQQKRWTQGWVQLQRLHLRSLLTDYRTGLLRKIHLTVHMCTSWQWPLYGIWMLIMPYIIFNNLWLGRHSPALALALYGVPSFLFLVLFTVIASSETRYTYGPKRNLAIMLRRVLRMIPYALINTAMLPHQFSAFAEGLFGSMHAEFERTPKTASNAGATSECAQPVRRQRVKVHAPYVVAELFFVAYNFGWAYLFFQSGYFLCAAGALIVALSVTSIMWFYGDHVNQRLFVIPASLWERKQEERISWATVNITRTSSSNV